MIDLKFYIIDNDTSVTTQLVNSPDGWNDEMITYERHKSYWGLLKSYSIPLKFVNDGADLLRTKYYYKGISANCILEIWKRNIYTNNFELKYSGLFDFSTSKDQKDYFEISMRDWGLAADIIDKETVKYDIGMPDILRYNGSTNNYETFNQLSDEMDGLSNLVDDPEITVEMGANNFRNINDGVLEIYNHGIRVLKDCRLTIKTEMGSRVARIQDVIVSDPSGWDTLTVEEKIRHYRGGVITELVVLTTDNLSVNTGYTHDITMPFVLEELAADYVDCVAGDEIYMFCTCTHHSSAVTVNKLRYMAGNENIKWSVGIYAPLPEKEIKCTTAKKILTELGVKLGNYAVKSDFLDSSRILFTTCGSIIEDWLYAKISLKEFFDYFNSLEPVGLGVEIINNVETLVFEQLDYFLQGSATPILVNDAKDLTIETAKELIPSTIKIGFQNQSYPDGYGEREFMAEREYKSPQKNLILELNLISAYRMDNAALDATYKNELTAGFGTADYKIKTWDNDQIFAADCNFVETIGAVDYYELNRTDITNTTTGFDWPWESFNLFYTPYRNLLRWGKYFRSVLKFFEADNLSIVKIDGLKNPYVHTQETGQPEIDDSITPVIGNFDTPLFMPFIATFTAPVTDSFETAFNLNPYAPIQAEIDGKTISGFLMSVSKKFAGKKESEFRLLLDTNNNLADFI